MTALATGVDLVEISRLETYRAEKPTLWPRFLRRVYTPREIEQAGESCQSLAGLFAAKEAAAKALGCGIGPVSWQELEILKAESGAPRLELHGKARELAAAQGLAVWSVSISHTRGHALAFVAALGWGGAGEAG